MLPKSRRVSRRDFKPLLESKKYLNSRHFSLKMALSKRVGVAVSVSKKVSKSAVIRNRTRRRAYAVLRELSSDLKPGLYLFMAKPGADKFKGTDLENELRSLVVSCLS